MVGVNFFVGVVSSRRLPRREQSVSRAGRTAGVAAAPSGRTASGAAGTQPFLVSEVEDTYVPVAGEETKDLSEYLAALNRRKWQILFTTAVLVLVTAAVAYLLPPVYRSTATILVQEQEIPAEFVRSTITSFADERIQVITQQVMTRATLLELVRKHDLYPTRRQFETNEEILDRMRKDIRVTPVNANITDRRGGSRVNATIAFTVSFDSDNPPKAQRTVNELVSVYLSENVKSRQLRTAETASFLAEEAERLRTHLAQLEQRLAEFKRRNQGRLPEQSQVTMQLIDRADQELLQIDRNISAIEERKLYIQGQLATVSPYGQGATTGERTVADPAERLRALRNHYVSLSGIYSESHPDIVRIKREIAALSAEVGETPPQDAAAEIAELRNQLAALREKYSEDHPDVVRVSRAIASLEASAKSAPRASAGRPASSGRTRPDNPLYVTLQTQIASADNEIRSLRAHREELRGRFRTYEQRLSQSPDLEREYLDITRERETTTARYQELKSKLMQAEVAQELEKERKAERFTLIEPPQLPERPYSPNRPAIFLIGLVLSVGGGFGLGVTLEALDRSIKGARDLARRVNLPILSIVPHVMGEHERAERARTRLLIVAAAALALVAGLVFIHIFVLPIQVLGYVLLRRFGIG